VTVDALEVDVQHDRAERVHLVVAQQHLLALAAQLHLEDGGVEGFLLQRKEEGVVIELDHGGRAGTVDDAGHLVRIAQAAARSGALQLALVGDEFHGDSSGMNNEGPRPGSPA